MKHYNSIPRVQDDGTLMGEEIWAFNKLDGQNFCVKYSPKRKEFGPFGSRKRLVDEGDEQFGDTVKYFKNSEIPNELIRLVKENSGKNQLFTGVQEITFFFEWYGENSFAGFHQEGDEMHLALIDVDIKKKGYIEPKPFYEIFGNNDIIETPEFSFTNRISSLGIPLFLKYLTVSPNCSSPSSTNRFLLPKGPNSFLLVEYFTQKF